MENRITGYAHPLVSIIIPCYNQAHYMLMTFESVLMQTLNDWECIIVNDGATDNTEEIALQYCQKDTRFIYYKQENKGLSAARNAGLKIAKGKYIQFLDSDDLIAPDKLLKQVALMEDKQIDVCTCHHDMFNDGDFEHRYTYPLAAAKQCFTIKDLGYTFLITPHDGLLRRQFLLDKDIKFAEQLRSFEDWFFWATLMVKGAKFQEIDEVLAHYRIHQDSMSKQKRTMCISSLQAAFYLYDILPKEERANYIQYETEQQYERILLLMQYKQWAKYRNSLDYKLGHFMLKPYRFCKKIYKKLFKAFLR